MFPSLPPPLLLLPSPAPSPPPPLLLVPLHLHLLLPSPAPSPPPPLLLVPLHLHLVASPLRSAFHVLGQSDRAADPSLPKTLLLQCTSLSLAPPPRPRPTQGLRERGWRSRCHSRVCGAGWGGWGAATSDGRKQVCGRGNGPNTDFFLRSMRAAADDVQVALGTSICMCMYT